ncbi:MAG: hypothetical protein AAB426_07310 [Myxococcota bacterium]
MKKKLRLSDWSAMSETDRRAALDALVADANSPPNGELADIDREIREYERLYEVPSDQMVAELNAGKRRETAEIASWLIALSLRDRLAPNQTRA